MMSIKFCTFNPCTIPTPLCYGRVCNKIYQMSWLDCIFLLWKSSVNNKKATKSSQPKKGFQASPDLIFYPSCHWFNIFFLLQVKVLINKRNLTFCISLLQQGAWTTRNAKLALLSKLKLLSRFMFLILFWQP